MKVKIGQEIYDSEKIPIMVILSDEEKDLISNMGSQSKFCTFPDRPEFTEKYIKQFMNI